MTSDDLFKLLEEEALTSVSGISLDCCIDYKTGIKEYRFMSKHRLGAWEASAKVALKSYYKENLFDTLS